MFIIAESNQLYLGDMLFYLVSFLIMAALVWHFAWKPVTQMMQKRADKIANDIDSAAQSRQEELKGSRQEAATIVDNAKQAGESKRAEIIARAQQDAQNLKNQAQKDAEQARQDALRGAKEDIANLSIEIASKLIHKQLNADDQQALIDTYIEGLVKHE